MWNFIKWVPEIADMVKPKTKYVYYSLGNVIIDQKWHSGDIGYIGVEKLLILISLIFAK